MATISRFIELFCLVNVNVFYSSTKAGVLDKIITDVLIHCLNVKALICCKYILSTSVYMSYCVPNTCVLFV